MNNHSEPPLSKTHAANNLFYLGKDSEGHWVVKDQGGLRGGLFVDRAQALRFALFENGRNPRAVIMVPGVMSLDLNMRPSPQNNTDREKARDNPAIRLVA
ncbi:hypothetical protein [Rhodoplanes sp. Z2-YC6860]|uniref:hypothetical protein n=1 Tax=Rhodoplanes sp. Z2-YC6860 TaxID=674703 RepID=UPI00078D422B|nr:hypothetical protein [Rhodoplanes sp. Z2-YC6860]AMN41978.1 hypothetical protein RHPLAN_35460 [Rhodoplanes sp. Z2-YC6860]